MKYCPACRSQYSDPTLRFCLQDGMILNVSEAKQSTIDTISFNDSATVNNILRTEEMNLFSPRSNLSEVRTPPPEPALLPEPEIKKSKSSPMVLLAVFPALLVIAGLGFGGWFYLKSQNKPAMESNNPADTSTPEIAQKSPPANNSASKVIEDDMTRQTNSNSETFVSSGSEDVKKEITEIIDSWKKAAEARKLPDYLSRYAEKVDYFDKTGASSAEIRTEAQKMFDTYNKIEIDLSNVLVAVNTDGSQATAIFDKEWSYETDKDLLEGKAHTKLQFQKNGKEWKIISEKYEKIYYKEN